MLKTNRRKIKIVLMLFVTSVAMMVLALATIASGVSILLISVGLAFMLISLLIWMTYFKE